MRTGSKSSSLGVNVARSILLVSVTVGVCQLAVFAFIVRSMFSALEYRNTQDDLGRVSAAIEAEKALLTELARDYAGWDEARDYIAGANPDFADENFTAEWVEVSKLDSVMIVSPEARVIWSGLHAGGRFTVVDHDDSVAEGRRPGSLVSELRDIPADAPAVGFFTGDSGVILGCAYPVTSSDYSSPPRGWVYFARRFDERMLGRIAERTGLTVELSAAGAVAGIGVKALEAGARYYDAGPSRRLLFPVLDLQGREIATLEASKARRLDAPAVGLLSILTLSLTLTVALTALVLNGLMRRLVVAPLVRIVGHLSLRAEDELSDASLDMGRAAGRLDEIGVVADRIDALLKGLEARKRELEAVNAELDRMAKVDHLTGLGNRRSFDEYAVREVKRLSREMRDNRHKGYLALLIGDIDHFKLYNDRYGHVAGDACLRAVADVIASCVRRPADLPFRFGGEEFIILLPGTDLSGALVVAENIRSSIEALALPNQDSPVLPTVTMSLGAAAALVEADFDLGGLVERADAAMYQAKAAGRNRVHGAG